MRYMSLRDAKPDMVLAYNLFDAYGHVLINGHTPLTQNHIDRLNDYGFNGIYISDELSEDIEIVTAITPSLRQDALAAIERQDIDSCCEIAKKIVEQITSSKIVSLDLTDLRSFDDYTYAHSVNVAITCCIVGFGMNLNQNDLSRLVTAALLHDLGKLAIPREILNKPGRLTQEEYTLIKSHSTLSYQMLSERPDLSSQVKAAVLSHHENVDGSGYPNGTTGEEQSLLTKILHVADVYDGLISKRPYKGPYSPLEAAEYLMGGCGIMFDQKVVQYFIQYVPRYPKGTEVTLSDGRQGLVYENGGVHNLRPIIRCMDKSMVDLSETENLHISIQTDTDSASTLMESERSRNKMTGTLSAASILAVDDLKTNLQMLRDILESSYNLIPMNSAAQAIKYLEAGHRPDLILMDIDMPEMNGLEATERINELTGGTIPVLFVTSLNDRETVLACRRLNAAGYILRPYNPVYISAEINRLVYERGENK